MRDLTVRQRAIRSRLFRTADLIVERTHESRREAMAEMEEIALLITGIAQNDRSLRDIGWAKRALILARESETTDALDNELRFALSYLDSAYDKSDQTQDWPLHMELAGTDNHRRKENSDA